MGNCLVTKLKSIVDNDNLATLGEAILKVKVTSEDGPQFQRIWSKVSQKVKTNGNYLSLNSDGSSPTNELTITANADFQFYLLPGEYNIIVEDKYHITYVGCGNNTYFDIIGLEYMTRLDTLALYGNSNVNGDVISLKDCISLSNFNPYGSKVSGSLDNMLDKMAEKRKSGSLNFLSGNEYITFNGEVAGANVFDFDNSGWHIRQSE